MPTFHISLGNSSKAYAIVSWQRHIHVPTVPYIKVINYKNGRFCLKEKTTTNNITI